MKKFILFVVLLFSVNLSAQTADRFVIEADYPDRAVKVFRTPKR